MAAWLVMPVHNCRAMTQEAIESCLAQEGVGDVRLLVSNNGSTDGTAEYLASLYPQVHAIHFYPQRYVSYAWNRALEHLFAYGEPYALVVNNDIRLRPDTYRHLIDDAGLFVTCVGTSSGAQFPGGEPMGVRRPHPDYSAFLIRRECWQRVGQFDESMRIACGDGDHHLRMHKAGIAAYCLDLPFYHIASGTMKSVSQRENEALSKVCDADREAFQAKWGFVMGSDTYYEQFR